MDRAVMKEFNELIVRHIDHGHLSHISSANYTNAFTLCCGKYNVIVATLISLDIMSNSCREQVWRQDVL
jgi:hypothetical protein